MLTADKLTAAAYCQPIASQPSRLRDAVQGVVVLMIRTGICLAGIDYELVGLFSPDLAKV